VRQREQAKWHETKNTTPSSSTACQTQQWLHLAQKSMLASVKLHINRRHHGMCRGRGPWRMLACAAPDPQHRRACCCRQWRQTRPLTRRAGPRHLAAACCCLHASARVAHAFAASPRPPCQPAGRPPTRTCRPAVACAHLAVGPELKLQKLVAKLAAVSCVSRHEGTGCTQQATDSTQLRARWC
jgi:hypothetical protein